MRRGVLVSLALAFVVSCGVGRAADATRQDRLGRIIADASLTDYRGASVSLTDLKDKPVVVLAFLGTECPLAKLAVTKLNALAKELEPRGVAVLGINSNRQDSLTDLAAQAKEQGVSFRLLKDAGNKLADAAGAIRTPEVVVLDQQRAIRYVGRIDDQDGIGYRRDTAKRQDLKIAIEDLLANKPVSVATTKVEGCFIGKVREPKRGAEVTYSKHVAPILQNRCMSCHRPGQVAPFAMTSYDEVAGWAETIAEVVTDDGMPPWHANPDHGQFANARTLPEDEKRVLLDWVKRVLRKVIAMTCRRRSRSPTAGNCRANRTSSSRCEIGRTTCRHRARCGSVLQRGPEADRGQMGHGRRDSAGRSFGRASRSVFAKTDAELRKFDGEGAFLAAYVPGFLPEQYPTGMAKLLPAGAKLIFQVHYTPNGKKTADLSRIGLLFADEKSVTHAVMTSEARKSGGLIIPPGADNSQHEANSPKSPVEVQLLNLMPHMHVRGKSFRYELQTADGRKETVLDVPRYDFNWQTSYQLAEPLRVPAGGFMHVVAHYDNSENNFNNPNPKATVRWGEQTWDEMLIGYFDIAIPRATFETTRQVTGNSRREAAAEAIPQVIANRILDRIKELDTNKDGTLTLDEVQDQRLRLIFKQLDLNGDEKLTVEEARKALEKKR